jgi:3-hydroxyanthranilate 3,4-dioxygenase
VDGEAHELHLGPGDMMTVPAKIPHSPIRHEGSIGLVVERIREGRGFTDGLLWFCDECNGKLHETYFELKDVEKDFIPHFREYYGNEANRTCKNCGHVMESDPRFV